MSSGEPGPTDDERGAAAEEPAPAVPGEPAPAVPGELRRRRRQVVAVGVVVALIVSAAFVLQRGGGGGEVGRGAVEEALADLAAAPALRYTTTAFGGQVRAPYEVTATGQALASMPPMQQLPGAPTMDILFVDDKLFFRSAFSEDLDLGDLGLDPDNPVAEEAFEDVQESLAESGLGGGNWATSVSEYDGPIIRNEMSPVGLALKLGDLLAETPDDRIVDAGEPVDGVRAVRATTPGGDIYVSAAEPHRVLRFVPAAARGADNAPDPTLPTMPSQPEMPTMPEMPDRPGRPGGSDRPELPEMPTMPSIPEMPDMPEMPEIPELPDLTTSTTRSNLVRPSAAQDQDAPGQEQPPGDEAEVGEETQQEDPSAAAPMLEGAVDRIDLQILTGDEVTRLYDDIRSRTEELADAVDSILQFAEGELTESLEAEIRAGRAFQDCGPDSCTVEADATLVHGRGIEVPAELTLELTADGRPAGECTGTGVVPVSGTGPLGCTNDSEEWAAAYRRGADIDAEVVEVQAMAFTADDVERVVQDLEQHAAEVREQEQASPEVRTGGLSLRGLLGAGRSTAQAPGDERLEAVLDELGVPMSGWDELVARAGQPRGDQPVEQVITPADVAVLHAVIIEMIRLEHGSRPLDDIDPDSARRVVQRALAAPDRTSAQGRPAQVTVAINRTPCSDLTCGSATVYGARQASRMEGVRYRVVVTGHYRTTPTQWYRDIRANGGDVQVAVPRNGMQRGGTQALRQIQTVNREIAAGNCGGLSAPGWHGRAGHPAGPGAPSQVRCTPRSVNSQASRWRVNTTLGPYEQDGDQQRTLQRAYDEARRASGGRLPASARNSFGGLRNQLAPQLRAVPGGAPLVPQVCTCPPCGPTRAPRRRPNQRRRRRH